MDTAQKNILWFKEIDKEDINLVGGKGANLGEMISFGIPVPPGFVVSASAYFYFLEVNNLKHKIKEILTHISKNHPESYQGASEKIANLILMGKMPYQLGMEIMKAYLKLGFPTEVFVAIRSSATAEDLPGASFAGQQKTFLNIKGETNVLNKVQECWASLFEARAIFYREEQGFDHLKVGIAVPVQKMIQSEASGIMFTIDPVNNEKNRLVIEAIYGLGEMIVSGSLTPDRYLIDKDSLEILSKEVVSQEKKLIKDGKRNKEIKIAKNKQERQKISDKQISELAKLGKKIHHHYFFPQDIEWGIEKGKIYILQTRPVTTMEQKRNIQKEKDSTLLSKKRELLLSGTPASPGIVSGAVRIIFKASEINKVKKGEILVTTMTTPDFVPAMRKAVAIVTDRGGQTSHAAIVSRELGIVCVVGTEKATKIFKNNQIITVNGKTGEIFKGGISVESATGKNFFIKPAKKDELEFVKTATKIYLNLAEPDIAFEAAKQNVDGVGLLRAEFMLAQIGIHPKKLIRDRKQKLFIDKLEEGLSIICEQFNPRPVIYRATDFKTNEYSNLKGGKEYEPFEANPMLGYRGAYRYISDPEVFDLELEAIRKVRRHYKNLCLMIPFVHQPWELAEIKKMIAGHNLIRSSTFKLWMMVEIPSNVISLEDFLDVGIDGVSIGTNDLTMLILGLDRDNQNVSSLFDERDPAVLWALEKVIKTCHKYKVTSSICGQLPSTHPEIVHQLIKWGITSVSVSPDIIDVVRRNIYEAENSIIKK